MTGWKKVSFYCYTKDEPHELWDKIIKALTDGDMVYAPFIGLEEEKEDYGDEPAFG